MIKKDFKIPLLSKTELYFTGLKYHKSFCPCVTFLDVCRDVADVKPQQEEEEREDNSFSENEMQCAEGVTDPRMSAPYTHIHTFMSLTSLLSFHSALHFNHPAYTVWHHTIILMSISTVFFYKQMEKV